MTTTLTMAGQLALAGAARPGATALGSTLSGAYGTHHQASAWTTGAIAKPATSMVFDGKNRPTRPLPEHSQ